MVKEKHARLVYTRVAIYTALYRNFNFKIDSFSKKIKLRFATKFILIVQMCGSGNLETKQ